MSNLVVLKVGGSLGGQHLDAVVTAIRHIQHGGGRIVIVHGGGPRITAALDQAGIEASFVDGQRATSPPAMEVVRRVLADEINPDMVKTLRFHAIPAVGRSGSEGILLVTPIPNLMRVGRVRDVHTGRILDMLEQGFVPVVAPIGFDEHGSDYNINADLAASAIAGALGAERVVFLTDVPGIYSDFAAKELLRHVNLQTLKRLTSDGRFSTGMIPKVEAVVSAVAAGVTAAYVVHGVDEHAVLWGATSDISESPEQALGTRVVSV